ncbi:hypothetical protein V2J09_019391 [Rumex salicifolius]
MASKDKKPMRPSRSRSGGIRTLADLNRRSGPDSDSDSDDGPQEYYTGGEKSGMMVQDPTKGNDVDDIFNQARQLGAVEGPTDILRPSSSSTSFTGTSRLLSGEILPPAPQQPEPVFHDIVFWLNGFTINNGPLRRMDDPENALFLESIKKSECPKELDPADRRSPVHVNLIKKGENYSEPERSTVAFQGEGRTLGGNSAASSSEPAVQSPPPAFSLFIDETKPTTSIQLRLADGTRIIAQFNHHHTINDIRGYIDSSRPGGSRNYQLQAVGFPPKPLNDPNQTIEQAATQTAADQNRSIDMPSSPSSSRSFTGTARRLSGEILPAAPQQPEPPTQELVLWNDGFTVNNGPFRRLDDTENASFLEREMQLYENRRKKMHTQFDFLSIKKAEIPQELMPNDDEVSGLEPERTTAPFQGEGRTLGGDSPASSSEPVVSAPPPALSLAIDETKPTTSIQIRLADGTRMIAQFNHHHTINDIRGFIDSSVPGGSGNYQLQAAGLPPKPLNDLNQTIEEADIANSVVFQKL